MRPTIGISHISQIETAIFDDFASEISHPALVFDIETRPAPAPYAAIEWLVPTTIILFIGKAYFEEFLKEMGKDHYHILKNPYND
ncbi:hypothetical protein [Pseudomonas fluorescens]|uniref:hypothetical protein n=1 Tax=Pseudomonas fluorescens TaxID=294 RepID=UPI00126A2148|nr:hypothetical protein [Pseudomonas fluorescens]